MTTPRPRHCDVTVTYDATAVVAAASLADERDHLRREHGLTRVDAWIAATPDDTAAIRNPTGSAARMAKHRARKREAGLITMDVPAAVAAEVSSAGGWQAWRDAIRAAAVLEEYQRTAAKWGMGSGAISDLLARPSPWRRLLLRMLVRSGTTARKAARLSI